MGGGKLTGASALNVAKYIINWCLNNNIQITNLKLQKLLYFVQGEYSKMKGERLIVEDFYTRQLGPVIPSIYLEYSIFASATLTMQKHIETFKYDITYIVNIILQKYAYRTTWDLIELSCQQDPWKYQYEIFGNNSLIPYKSIVDYFKINGRL